MKIMLRKMRSKYFELEERFKRSINKSDRYDLILVSYGGSGTTFILRYLQQFMRVNSWDSHNDGIKHANAPNHPIFAPLTVGKCLYIYSDPIQASLSLFRRGFQTHMIPKLTDSHYRNTTEYNQRVRLRQSDMSFGDFIDQGKDAFGMNAHWRNWNERPAGFPILFVRFEKLYDNLPEIFDFLGLPEQQRAAFPPRRERGSSVDRTDEAVRRKLEAIYGETLADMDARPPVFHRNVTPQAGSTS